jgi:WD40 repeat protein
VQTPTQQRRVCILDAADGKVLSRIDEPDTANLFAFSTDGKVLAGAGGNVAFLWDVATGKELARHTTAVSLANAAFSPDVKMVAAPTGDVVRLFDVASGKELPPGPRLDSPANSIGLTPDGRTLVTADGIAASSIRVWDTATGEQRQRLEGHEGQVTQLLLSGDGRTLFSCEPNKGPRIWDVATGRQLPKFTDVPPLACSPDGKLIAVRENPWGVRLVDTTTGRSVLEVGTPGPYVKYAAFLPDGRSLVVNVQDLRTGKSRAHVWDLTTGKDTRQFELPEPVNVVGQPPRRIGRALSPDGRLIAIRQDDMIAVHELAGGTQVCRSEKLVPDPGPDILDCLALSPDGRTVAWGSKADSLVRLLDVVTGKERHAFAGHSGGIVSLTFSADGKTLVSGSTDTTVLVWDMTALPSRPESRQPAKPVPPRQTPTFTSKATQRE